MTTKKNKKQGAVYGRKSRENEATLENQINACLEWAEKNDIEVEIFAEEGTQSSEDWNRPKLQAMLKKIENLEFNYVIVSESSRISRTEDFSIFKKLMKETGTILIEADSNNEINFLDRNDAVKSGIQQVFNEYELDLAKTRLIRGTVQSAKKGNWVGKKPPVGYKYDHETKRLKKTEDAKVIREMFEMYLSGMSTVEISHEFTINNVKAYHKKGGVMIPVSWSKSTISRILNNIAYVGHTLYGKTKLKKVKGKRIQNPVDEEQQILVEGTHEPIVTPEEWEQIQKIMKKKRTLPPALKHSKHTFSGLVVCANCNAVHTFEKSSSKIQTKRISSCKTRVYDKDFIKYKMCGNSGGVLEDFEKLFYASLRETKEQISDYIDLIKKMQATGSVKGKALETQKNIKLQQIEQMKKKRKKIQGFLEEDFYEGEEEIEKIREVKQLANRIKEIEAEIEKLEEKEGESEIDHVERVLQNINNFFSGVQSSVDEKILNDFLSEFVEKITYKKSSRWDEMTIEVHLKEEIQEIIEEEDLIKTA